MSNKEVIRIAVSIALIFLMIGPPLLIGGAQQVDLHLQDSDDDGLSDWDEINRYESNPYSRDSDEDSIDDEREVTTGTSPIDDDSDGDGFPDKDEYALWIPSAPIPECWYRCPYIADLPEFDLMLTRKEIVKHYTVIKGNEIHNYTTTTAVEGNRTEDHWNRKVGYDFTAWTQLSTTTQICQGIVGWTMNWELGGRFEVEHGQTYLWKGSTYDTYSLEDKDLFDNYTKNNWEVSKMTLHMDVTITNSYSREVRLDTAVFDLISGDERYSSEVWSPGKVFEPGEKQSVDVSFTLTGEEWIRKIVEAKTMILDVNKNSVDLSVLNDVGLPRFESEATLNRRVWDRCALVNIDNSEYGEIRKFITAHVDKLDGLNVLEALDRLFIPYTYRYGRMMSLAGTDSVPKEKIWGFEYRRVWHDTDTSVNETSFVDIQMRNRGALLLSLYSDTDGDWLTDDIERRVGTNITLTDTDGDYADDYVEVVLTKSDPRDPDTDGGGTLDGIEYYEGLNPLDASDDILNPPDWYRNHFTMQTAQRAANLLLQNAINPCGSCKLCHQFYDSPR